MYINPWIRRSAKTSFLRHPLTTTFFVMETKQGWGLRPNESLKQTPKDMGIIQQMDLQVRMFLLLLVACLLA